METHSTMAKSGLWIVQKWHQRLKDCCKVSSRQKTSGTASNQISSYPPHQLEDFRQELRHQGSTDHSNGPQHLNAPNILSPPDSDIIDIEPAIADFSLSTTNFDEAYWMKQISQIPAAPASTIDFDTGWDALLFD
jgi:hypothetical protein